LLVKFRFFYLHVYFWALVYFSTFKYYGKFYHTNCTNQQITRSDSSDSEKNYIHDCKEDIFLGGLSRNRTRKFISICVRARSNFHSKFCDMWHIFLVCNIPFNLWIRFWNNRFDLPHKLTVVPREKNPTASAVTMLH